VEVIEPPKPEILDSPKDVFDEQHHEDQAFDDFVGE
jgi:hypothetical protein